MADGLLLYQVDSFTNEAYAGNPAAVCIMEREMSDGWMQAVAREMNLSETAFLFPIEKGYSLRWFTPIIEVDLCGHATLAAAHVLWEENLLERNEKARFFNPQRPAVRQLQGPLDRTRFPIDARQRDCCSHRIACGTGPDVETALCGKKFRGLPDRS